jgi:hypothetical protein
MDTFHFQYLHNRVYRSWCDLVYKDITAIKTPDQVPALPISFFKTHRVVTTDFVPAMYFESSGTTQTLNSRHWLKDPDIYRKSFTRAFERFYGPVRDWCVIGLLPAYLERQHSSLVMMVDEMVKMSEHSFSGFYLYEHQKLADTLGQLEARQQKTLLIGVTFALLDFAEAHPQKLEHTIVMETGGMKGRKKEMTRAEVHDLLAAGLGISKLHAEYGMTELLSQAYSKGDGRFCCPPWMKVLVRDEEDPLHVQASGRGLLQVIDLANVYSAAFIATEDVGVVYEDGSFEVWGRLDHSDLRGCSLLVV